MLVKKGNWFSLPFVLQVLLLALAPGHAFHPAQLSTLTQAQTQALLSVGSTVDQLGDKEKVCLH